MLKMLLVYGHLIGTCLALGMMAMTDLRMLRRVMGYNVVIPPPSRFELNVITSALALLLATGAMLLIVGQQDNPNYLLGNEKLQGKLVLVGLLCANALVLHFGVFHHLSRFRPVASWSARQRDGVALAVGLSNSMWLYCAFLGIARPWNQSMAIETVLLIGLVLWALTTCGARLVLEIAARNERPSGDGDWIDAVKRVINEPDVSPRAFEPTMIVSPQERSTIKRVA